MYSQRKRAKDATVALLRRYPDEDIDEKVYVTDEGIVLDVEAGDDLEDYISGIMSLGVTVDEIPYIGDCLEFYQARGLTRFRGV